MKLGSKFLLSFFFSTLLAIVVLVALMQVGLREGYDLLVLQSQLEEIRTIEKRLLDFYEQKGSWEPLRHNTELRNAVIGLNEVAHGPIGGPPPVGPVARRISLYDSERNSVFGRRSIEEVPILRPLTLRGDVAGYVGLVPTRALQGGPDAGFLSRQLLIGVIAGTFVLLIALTMAYLLSRRILAPVQQLTQGSARLRAGDTNTKLDVTGNDELTKLCEDFNELAATLRKNDEDRHQWTSDIAHELRTPVTVLQTQLDAIVDGVFEPDPERLALLSRETDRLTRLIDDLYLLSLADSGQLRYRKSICDPTALLEQSIDRFMPVCAEKSIDVELASSLQGSCRILADPDRLLQVFANILQNSCRYTDANGRIEVNASESDGNVLVSFEDSHPGVSDSQLSNLFDRLYRVEKSRSRRYGGAGLGLALCEAIVSAHDGTIRAFHSDLGGIGIECSFPKAGTN